MIAAWKDTQAPNLPPKFIFNTSKIAFNFEQKVFFSLYIVKLIILPRRTPKRMPEAEISRFGDSSSRFQDIGNFLCFYMFSSIFNAVSKVAKCIMVASFARGSLLIQLS